MSPEQVEGRPTDHRSDVFSFGCVAYEAVSGSRAFAGPSTIETLHRIANVDPTVIVSALASALARAPPHHRQVSRQESERSLSVAERDRDRSARRAATDGVRCDPRRRDDAATSSRAQRVECLCGLAPRRSSSPLRRGAWVWRGREPAARRRSGTPSRFRRSPRADSSRMWRCRRMGSIWPTRTTRAAARACGFVSWTAPTRSSSSRRATLATGVSLRARRRVDFLCHQGTRRSRWLDLSDSVSRRSVSKDCDRRRQPSGAISGREAAGLPPRGFPRARRECVDDCRHRRRQPRALAVRTAPEFFAPGFFVNAVLVA